LAATTRETKAGVSSLRFDKTRTFSGRAAKASAARFAAQPVTYTRACVRAAREAAWRDLRKASWVTQQVFTTATSARPAESSSCPSASNRSRTACASVCETLQPRKPAVNVATGGELTSFPERGDP